MNQIRVEEAQTRPSKLAAQAAAIREVLGHDLPADFAQFYGETDGLEVGVENNGERSMASAEIVRLEVAFDGFKPHRQSAGVDEYDPDYSEPHVETVWSPDADVDDDASLERMNTLRRSKLVMSMEGLPEWIVVDFSPPEGGFEGRGYQLIWLYEGSESHSLSLDFPTLVRLTKQFGAMFYHAYLPRHMFSLDEVRAILAPYAPLHPEEVQQLLRIAAAS